MDLNVTPASLVNAGGALLFVLEGIAILAIGRGTRHNLLLGVLVFAFGLTFVADNLLVRGDGLRDALIRSFAAPAIVATLALTAVVARSGGRTTGLALGVTLTVFLASYAVAFHQIIGIGQDLAWFSALGSAVALLMLATGFRTRTPSSSREGIPLGLVALGFGLWGSFAQMLSLSVAGLPDPRSQAGTFGICAASLAGILAWAVPAPSAPWRLRVFLALACAAATGIGLAPLYFDQLSAFGLFGIMRTLGAACLAIAIVKHDLLGVPLPHIAVRRGVLATAALAALFIGAQVAQNFFAAEYGLLMGGVVAGAVVFAASPIQRAMEAKSQRLPASPTAPSTVGNERREEDFRNAVRLALRDRRISVEEEHLLFRLAESLGVGAGRAHELRHEVESRMRRRRP